MTSTLPDAAPAECSPLASVESARLAWTLRLAPMALGAIALAASPILASEEFPAQCWSRKHFDEACPSCGLTRGIALCVKGQFGDSISMHPIAILLVLQTVIAAVVTLVAPKAVVSRMWMFWLPLSLAGVSVLALIVWVIRFFTATLPPL